MSNLLKSIDDLDMERGSPRKCSMLFGLQMALVFLPQMMMGQLKIISVHLLLIATSVLKLIGWVPFWLTIGCLGILRLQKEIAGAVRQE